MTSPKTSRRDLLRGGAIAGLGIAVAGSVDAIAASRAAAQVTRRSAGYGPLIPDPNGLLSLPAGFSYQLVAQAGVTTLETGEPTPGDADGTACFSHGGGFVLVNNHEIDGSESFGVPPQPGLTFDPGARGGTTNIVADSTGKRVSEYVSLAGTHNNCAGGRTPWQTWLTCEESEQRAGGTFQRNHGYVFEVDPFDRSANVDPVPLKFLGRYPHEAVAVDRDTSAIYLTEDANNPHGLFYRWTPPGSFHGGKGALRGLALGEGGDTAGRLQAMTCYKGTTHVHDLCLATRPGTTYKVRWVDVPDRDAANISVRRQFANDQVTRSRKLEGAYWGDGGAYFIASFARTTDGSVVEHDGQVWFYDPATETVTLRTIFGVNPDPTQDTDYDGPDNIAISPYGGLIVAEDGAGINHLIGVTAKGNDAYPLARNDVNGSEFTGPTFSDDGRILFANIHSPGYVFAISGPWSRSASGDL
ncbi:alkaline phosphatase PhoX [Micromonospora sp. NPDC005305]|uniref:alkaline phosphatase PhoX n=1 Tax=Micromonospora sp. NPDC005305 TaxID=3156875 RepID=UPI0033AAAEDA